MSNFFVKAFGFQESKNYTETQNLLEVRTRDGKINNIPMGVFTTVSVQKNPPKPGGRVILKNIIGNVKTLITQYPGSLFQMASQSNYLEMATQNVIPENGITIYQKDNTQGPIVAIQTPAATAYRNYLIEFDGRKGQTEDHQLDGLRPLHNHLEQVIGMPPWNTQNGYAMIQNSNTLDLIKGI